MCFAKKAKKPAAESKDIVNESVKSSHDPSTNKSANGPSDKKGSELPFAPTPGKAAQPTKDVNPMVQKWVQRTLDTGVMALSEEFRALAKWIPEGMTTEAFNANKEKNRYQDVPCQDKGRIVLKFPGVECDYIHANYVGVATNPKKFICAQGPLENTQHSFWAMALQEKVEFIIMLCNCIEMAKIKCHQYWPLEKDQKLTFGEGPNQITITNQGSQKMAPEEQCINKTTLKVDWAEGSRTIQHLQWENWPDRGVPQTNLTAINLLSSTRGNQNPILVHCSAGIGRTGTIVAIAYVQDKMMSGEDCMAMNELLKELRSHRPWSIQNEFQYLYLHRVLLAYFLERHKETYEGLLVGANGVKYKKWVEDYASITATTKP